MSTANALSILAALHRFAADVAAAVLGGHHAPEGITALLEIRDWVVFGVIAGSRLDGGRQIDHLRACADRHYDVDLLAAERAGVKFVGTSTIVEDPRTPPSSPAAPERLTLPLGSDGRITIEGRALRVHMEEVPRSAAAPKCSNPAYAEWRKVLVDHLRACGGYVPPQRAGVGEVTVTVGGVKPAPQPVAAPAGVGSYAAPQVPAAELRRLLELAWDRSTFRDADADVLGTVEKWLGKAAAPKAGA